jgi:hypothetical protein
MSHQVNIDHVKDYQIDHDLASSVGIVNKRLQVRVEHLHARYAVRHNNCVVFETVHLTEAVDKYNSIS